MTGGFLCEPEPNHLAHSRISAEFAVQRALQDWVTFIIKYSAPTAGCYTEATEKWGDTVRRDQTAYNIAFETDLPFFEHIGRDEETTALFARYMRSLAQSKGMAMKFILEGFDWVSLGKSHVVDVSTSYSLLFHLYLVFSLNILSFLVVIQNDLSKINLFVGSKAALQWRVERIESSYLHCLLVSGRWLYRRRCNTTRKTLPGYPSHCARSPCDAFRQPFPVRSSRCHIVPGHFPTARFPSPSAW